MEKSTLDGYLLRCKIAANFRILPQWNEDSKVTISDLGYTLDDIKNVILDLCPEDYLDGPLPDFDGYAGDFYEFGKLIAGKEIYIKIKVKNFNELGERQLCLMCKSFHYAKKPLSFPLKK